MPVSSAPAGPVVIPTTLIADSVRQIDLPDHFIQAIEAFNFERFEGMPPAIYFEVVEDSNRGSREPDRALIVCLDPELRERIIRDLEVVKTLESDNKPRLRLFKLSLTPKTPLRAVFRQLADTPLTVFSMTVPGTYQLAFFYVRTAFTVAALKEEMRWAEFRDVSPVMQRIGRCALN